MILHCDGLQPGTLYLRLSASANWTRSPACCLRFCIYESDVDLMMAIEGDTEPETSFPRSVQEEKKQELQWVVRAAQPKCKRRNLLCITTIARWAVAT